MVTLDEIRSEQDARLFPQWVLEGAETALVLFAAAFMGKQDAAWVEKAGMHGTCVDLDEAKLLQMAEMYPPDWDFITADVFEWTNRLEGPVADVVTVDCPTNLFDQCGELVHVWCGLARKAVVLGTGIKSRTRPPTGWRIQDSVYRSSFAGGTWWTVLTPKVTGGSP